MDRTELVVAAATVTVASYRLRSIRQADVRTGRRTIILALAAVALLYRAVVLLSAMDSFSRDVVLLVEEAKMDLLKMEEIFQDIQKQNRDLMNNLSTMLSNKNSMSYNRVTSPDDAENAELTATMKDADVYQPSKDNVHTGEIMEEAPKVNHEAAPGGDTSPPSQAEAMGTHKEKPWRVFLIPSDHLFVLDCLDDELIVRIMPRSDKESILASVHGFSCRKQHQAAGMMVPFLHTLLTSPPGTKQRVLPHHTLFMMSPPGKDQRVLQYHTLFMSPPGKEHVVPVPLPRKVTAATLRTEHLPIEEMTEVVPESFTLSPNVVAFYCKAEGGKTAMLIAPTDSVEHSELVEEEAYTTLMMELNAPEIIPILFRD